MAIIKGFRAMRPKKEFASRVAELPYDVYSLEEARQLIENNEASIMSVNLPLATMPVGTEPYTEEVYQKAASNLATHKEKYFLRDEVPMLYIYELEMEGRKQTGLVCTTAVDDYLDENIRKHEKTRLDKERDRMRHLDAIEAHTGPIFMVYRSRERILDIIGDQSSRTPDLEFTSDDQVTHRVWTIGDQGLIGELIEEFAKVPKLYIADGHHRSESAAQVCQMRREENPDYTGEEEFNYFMSILFPMELTKVYDYNRVIKDLNGQEAEEFLTKLEENFILDPAPQSPYKPEARGYFGLYLGGEWYRLKLRDGLRPEDPVKALDVSVLQDLVLDPILGIEDPRKSDRIDFVGGIRGLEELEKRCERDMTLAFSMYPTAIEELIAVADMGVSMPPKSTWFEPKPRSGLFIHEID